MTWTPLCANQVTMTDPFEDSPAIRYLTEWAEQQTNAWPEVMRANWAAYFKWRAEQEAGASEETPTG
jgi:hypothetical protein